MAQVAGGGDERAAAPRVGFVGAGQLGEPMVERLLTAGIPVLLYARRPEVADRLARLGAVPVPSLPELGAQADVVISCLFNDAQLTEVALGGPSGDGLLAAMAPGSVLASHTTGTLATVARLADAAAARDVQVVEAPISGTAADIRAGKLTVLLAGAPAALDAVEPVLRAGYADPVLRTGALGSALKVKLINNVLFAAHSQLAADAIRLAGELDVDPAQLIAALSHCSGESRAAGYVLDVGGAAAFAAAVLPFLRKDVAACEQVAAELGADLGFMGRTVQQGPLDLIGAATTAS